MLKEPTHIEGPLMSKACYHINHKSMAILGSGEI